VEKKEIKIVCKRIEKNFIDVIVKGSQDWRLTGFYGEPSWNNKYKSWEYIRELHANVTCHGYFLGISMKSFTLGRKKRGGGTSCSPVHEKVSGLSVGLWFGGPGVHW
jgi:hypothetical protein